MPDKLTDKEIVKALKEILELMLCEGDLQKSSTISHAIDLINRLQARIGIYETCNARKDEAIKHLESEVKRLQAENERLIVECGNQSTLWSKHFEGIFETAKETIKAEAYKEFAERVKEAFFDSNGYYDTQYKRRIDNLLKELVGEDK